MSRRWWLLAAVVVATLAALLWFRPEGGPTFEPVRLDVALNVLTDGTLEVEERGVVRFETATSTFIRRVPGFQHDGVSALMGSMDGREFPPGKGEGQLEIKWGPALDVTWHLQSPATGQHEFVLKYRAANTIHVSGIRGTLAWRVLSGAHGYEPANTCVTLTIPESAVVLENPGFDEARAPVTEQRNGQDAMCAVVSNGDSLTRRVTFTIDTMKLSEPAWQNNQRRARDLMPAFVSAGLFLLVIGVGVIAMLRFKYAPFPVSSAETDQPVLTPPMETALSQRRYTGDVAASLVKNGLIDFERMSVARDLGRAGHATFVVGAVCWIVARRWLGDLDIWPLAIAAGFLISAALFWWESRRMPILTERGIRARDRVLYSARVRNGQTSA